MKGIPAVVTYSSPLHNSVYAFIWGNNNRLLVCFWNVFSSSWQWDDLGVPVSGALNSSPGVTATFLRNVPLSSGLFTFVVGSDAQLHERSWDGRQWLDWQVRGRAGNDGLVYSPSASAIQSDTVSFVRACVLAVSGGTIFLAEHATGQPSLIDRGQPGSGINAVSEPVTLVHQERLYTYVVGSDNNLHTAVVTITTLVDRPLGPPQTRWRNLRAPERSTLVSNRPASIVLNFILYSFNCTSDGQFWVHRWRGESDENSGSWLPLGTPSGTTVMNAADPVTFRFGDTEFIYVFIQGANHHLYVFRWDGNNDMIWADLGMPSTNVSDVPVTEPGTVQVVSAPGATSYRFVQGNQTTERIYAFVFGDDDHLHVCYWNGNDLWLWTDLGTTTGA